MVEHRAEIIDCGAIPAGADEVMLLLFWHLGDVLNSTALLPALRERHGRRLTFVTGRACVPLLRNHPDLDRIRVVDFPMPQRVTRDIWRWLAGVHEELFPGHAAVYNLHQRPNMRRMAHHVIQHWAALAGLDPRAEAWKPYFRPESAFARCLAADYLVLGNGGRDPARRWPAPRWRRLLAALRERHPALAYIQLGMHTDPLIEGAQDHRGATFDDGYHWITGARACITNDSFIGHFAATTECPTVAIYGPTSPIQCRPLSRQLTALGGHYYRTQWTCSKNLCGRLVGTHPPCLAFPAVRQVLAATERALSLAHPRDPVGSRRAR